MVEASSPIIENFRSQLETKLGKLDLENRKGTLVQYVDIVIPTVADYVHQKGVVIYSHLVNLFRDYFEGYNSPNSKAILFYGLRSHHGIELTTVGEALIKIYGGLARIECKSGEKKVTRRSRILYSSEERLEEFVRKYTKVELIPIVSCSFEDL